MSVRNISIPALEAMSTFLNGKEVGVTTLHARIEIAQFMKAKEMKTERVIFSFIACLLMN